MNEFDYIKIGLDVLLVIITGWAFIYARKEYRLHRKREKAETIARFNERYSNDKNIEAVVKLLMNEKNGEEKAKDGLRDKSLNYQKEMFLRFFEELQIFMEAGSLDTKLVYDTFAHYALKAFEKGTGFYEELTSEKLSEVSKGDWYRFGKFINEMKKYENDKSTD